MQERRLVAIMFTDIVGYTSLMGNNESDAFRILNANRQIHKKSINEFHGKLLKEIGDGILSYFENGTEAVQCAIKIQQEASKNNISLRIGIHEGEVVFEDGDVFGDGVNIASRIQDEAAHGGICVSDSVYRIIKNKIDIKTELIGSKHLKNVDETIKLYQVKAEGVNFYHPIKDNLRLKGLRWLIVVAASLLIFSGGWFINETAEDISTVSVERFTITLPSEAPVVCESGSLPVAISPDGSLIVYQSYVDNTMYLYKRYLNQYDAFVIPGTEDGGYPFFSPDGKWIGFMSNRILKKVLLDGGIPEDICEVPASCSFGSTWSSNDMIIFGVNGEGLKSVQASGGPYSTLTSVNQAAGEWVHTDPHGMPDGKSILFTARNSSGHALYIKSIDLRTKEEKVIIKEGRYPIYSSSGHLLFVKDNHLMAAPFNRKKVKTTSSGVVLIENIAYVNPHIGLSNNGTLVYVPEKDFGLRKLIWVDMNGSTQPIVSDVQEYYGPRISPDGNKIAMYIPDQSSEHVYIYDLLRESFDKLTTTAHNYWPVWTPDGKYVAFPSTGRESQNLYWKRVDNSSPAEAMIDDNIALSLIENKMSGNEKSSDYIFQPQMWTSDGRYLLFVLGKNTAVEWDILLMDMENERQIIEFIATEYSERHPRVSPDCQWLAYQSRESGKYEIYVTKFPEKGGKWQVSVDGGIEPIWSQDGKRIYYRHGTNWKEIMAVNIETDPGFHAEKPDSLFAGNYPQVIFGWNYDLHFEGEKFVMVKELEMDSLVNQIYVVCNLPTDIKSKFEAVQ